MKIQIPEKANQIIGKLLENGYEAYVVGGCVRDAILGRIAADWDITTNAKPEEVKALFRRTIDTGIEHGTVTVMIEKEGFEVTTYRIDGKYEDSRHPKEVIFTPSLEEDLKRRDFTINAMAYNDEKGLVDIFAGISDLERGCIRCVGNPKERFTEDALRILRAIRFSAQLGFEIEKDTAKAASDLAKTLEKISAERIQVELVKLLISNHPERIKTAYELGITAIVLPDFDPCMVMTQENPHHCYPVGDHTIEAIKQIAPEKVLRLTMLLHDFGKPKCKTIDEMGIAHFKGHAKLSEEMAKEILRGLKFDNDTIQKVTRLIKYHDYREIKPTHRAVRRAIYKIGEDIFPLYLEVRKADSLAQTVELQEEKIKAISRTEEIYQEILVQKDCLSLKDLAVKGHDLIEAGVKPGPELGKELQRLLEVVLEEPEKNTKESLLQCIKSLPPS